MMPNALKQPKLVHGLTNPGVYKSVDDKSICMKAVLLSTKLAAATARAGRHLLSIGTPHSLGLVLRNKSEWKINTNRLLSVYDTPSKRLQGPFIKSSSKHFKVQ